MGAGRYNHAMVAVDRQLIMIGGVRSGNHFSTLDVEYYDIGTHDRHSALADARLIHSFIHSLMWEQIAAHGSRQRCKDAFQRALVSESMLRPMARESTSSDA